MISEVVKAALLIFVAEMGDKSQLLAMAFALQYSIAHVISGVALGAFLNHGLAVALGAYVSHILPIGLIRLVSAVGFIVFGLWSLKQNEEEEESSSVMQGHPILIVATAFFLGELGDKTQLTAIALASSAVYPGVILAGTVTGMVLTSLVGILVGIKLGERIPEGALRLISAFVFIGFGVYSLWYTLPVDLLTPTNVTVFCATLLGVIIWLIIPPFKARLAAAERGEYGRMQRVARELRLHLTQIEAAVEEICLGENRCVSCRGKDCPVGYCKDLVKQALRDHMEVNTMGIIPRAKPTQKFDPAKIRHALALIREEFPNCEGFPEIETVVKRTEAVLQILARNS